MNMYFTAGSRIQLMGVGYKGTSLIDFEQKKLGTP